MLFRILHTLSILTGPNIFLNICLSKMRRLFSFFCLILNLKQTSEKFCISLHARSPLITTSCTAIPLSHFLFHHNFIQYVLLPPPFNLRDNSILYFSTSPFTSAPFCIISYILFTNRVSFSQYSPKYYEKYGLWEIVLWFRGKRGLDSLYFATYVNTLGLMLISLHIKIY